MSEQTSSSKTGGRRKLMLVGNWKMNKGGHDGFELGLKYMQIAINYDLIDVIAAPPFTLLSALSSECEESGSTLRLAGQTLHAEKQGAYTGEISGAMLKECGCSWVLIGHSERRHYFSETDEHIAKKTAAAFREGLSPIVCVGETLTQREAGETLRVIELQVNAVIDLLVQHRKNQMAIAYEPVWAIGTGKIASTSEAEEVHSHIRFLLDAKSEELGKEIRLLYGGSVKPDHASALFTCKNVDGALVGGASLDAATFEAIAAKANAAMSIRVNS